MVVLIYVRLLLLSLFGTSVAPMSLWRFDFGFNVDLWRVLIYYSMIVWYFTARPDPDFAPTSATWLISAQSPDRSDFTVMRDHFLQGTYYVDTPAQDLDLTPPARLLVYTVGRAGPARERLRTLY